MKILLLVLISIVLSQKLCVVANKDYVPKEDEIVYHNIVEAINQCKENRLFIERSFILEKEIPSLIYDPYYQLIIFFSILTIIFIFLIIRFVNRELKEIYELNERYKNISIKSDFDPKLLSIIENIKKIK